MAEKQTFEIPEAKAEPKDSKTSENVTVAQAEESGLTSEEIEAGKRQGLIIESEGSEESSEESSEVSSEESGDKPEEQEDKKEEKDKQEEPKDSEDDTKGESDNDKQKTRDYNANEKALYFKQKKEKKKRQKEQERADYYQLQFQKQQKDLAEIKEALKKQEKQQSDQSDPVDDFIDEDAPASPKDVQRIIDQNEEKKQEKIAEEERQKEEKLAMKARIKEQYKEAQKRHPDFDKTTDLASEIIENDESGTYGTQLMLAAANPEADVAEIAYNIGRLHPKYGKSEPEKTESEGKGKEKIDRIIKNAGRRPSSGTVSGGGTRKVSEDDLSVDDAAQLSQEDFGKLSRETRQRILEESCQ